MAKMPAIVLTVVILAGLTTAARAGDIAFGEYLSGECVTCHRVDGQDKGIPPIVGWPADQFTAVLQSYKAKDRANQVMQTIAGRLSDQDMDALATYFESLKPK
ncbi:MAG: c-type cytochrome [Hyphomicrobiaceae bacterium]